LWASALRHAPAYTADVDALAAGLAPLATGDGDALRPALTLIDSYALLGGEAFRAAHGAAVVAALRAALDSVRERGVLAILDVLDTLLAVWPPPAAASLIAPLVGDALAPVLGPRGPRRRPPSGVVVAAAAASALRLAALSPAAFSAALASAVARPPHGAAAAGGAPTEEAALQAFLVAAHGHLDIMFTARRRRMAVLGWVTLLAAAPASTALLASLPALVDAVVQVLADDAPAAGGGGEAFANVVARSGEGVGDGGADADDDGWDPTPPPVSTPEDARRAAVAAADDAAGGRLPAAARAAFGATAAAVGGDAYAAALGRVDERVLRQAQAWLAT